MAGPEFVTIPGERLGPDRERRAYPTDTRFWITGARWAQRAVNAWRAVNPGSGGPIEVDDVAGPITMAALRDISPGTIFDNYPVNETSTSSVLIDKNVADRLALLSPVADPERSASRPAARPASADAMSIPARRRSWLIPLGVLGAVILVGAGGYWFWRSRQSGGGVRGLGSAGCNCAPVPAKGDPRGHVVASTRGISSLRAKKKMRAVRK